MTDDRLYRTFYGIFCDNWEYPSEFNAGGYDQHYILIDDYVSDAASTTSDTAWISAPSVFIYPHHIKKKYYIEGVIEGQITFHTSSTGSSFVSDYRVSIIKVDNGAVETELATTGVINVNDFLNYDAEWHTGEDIVYPFWIDVYTTPQEIGENERLGVKVEWDVNNSSTVTASLMHDNDADYEDLRITIPFLL